MSGIELTTVVLIAAWLAVLSGVLILVIRQVTLLMVDAGRREPDDLENGLPIGAPVPPEVVSLRPQLAEEEPTYLLFVSPQCVSCRSLVGDLGKQHVLEAPIIGLVGGSGRRADELADLFPESIDLVRDPDATSVLQAMQLRVVPVALQIESGFITGKASVRHGADLLQLIRAHDSSDAKEMARNLREVVESAR